MPVDFLTEAERERLSTFPDETDPSDLAGFFTLAPKDLTAVRRKDGDHNRLGFALQICALRYLGFIPADLTKPPKDALQHICNQLDVAPATLDTYGTRANTRQQHANEAVAHLGFRKASRRDLEAAFRWLLRCALDHDRPLFLMQALCEHFYVEQIVRPGLSQLERLVARSRKRTQRELFARTRHLLTPRRRRFLDGLLQPDKERGPTPLYWLSRGETSTSAKSIKNAIRRLQFLRGNGVPTWDLSALSPNRIKLLAQLARRYSNQACVLQLSLPSFPPARSEDRFAPGCHEGLRARSETSATLPSHNAECRSRPLVRQKISRPPGPRRPSGDFSVVRQRCG